jgi:hypothetical protein
MKLALSLSRLSLVVPDGWESHQRYSAQRNPLDEIPSFLHESFMHGACESV